jgi:hypothetical protein
LAKFALIGNLSKESEEKDQINVPALVIRPGSPVSEISGRDLPSPAEIRSDNNVMLLPFYQEIMHKADKYGKIGSKKIQNPMNKRDLTTSSFIT